jgi:hypothetical protein
MTKEDLIIAFFPCTRFEAIIPLQFRGEAIQQKKWSDEKKLEHSMKLHTELHRLYMCISKMSLICIRRGLRLVIENPYTQPHYLTSYWCLKPSIIDKDRTLNGDYYKKPTQYWFIGMKPKNNLVFEPLEPIQQKNIMNEHNKAIRSLISSQYASRFIRQYLIEGNK